MALESLSPDIGVAQAASPMASLAPQGYTDMAPAITNMRSASSGIDGFNDMLLQRLQAVNAQPDLSGQVSEMGAALQDHRAKYQKGLEDSYSPEAQNALDWQAIGKMGTAMMQPATNGGNAFANGAQAFQNARDANQATLDQAQQVADVGRLSKAKEDYASILSQQALQKSEKDSVFKEALEYAKVYSAPGGGGDPGEIGKLMNLLEKYKDDPDKVAYIKSLIQAKFYGQTGKDMAILNPDARFGSAQFVNLARNMRTSPTDIMKLRDKFFEVNNDGAIAQGKETGENPADILDKGWRTVLNNANSSGVSEASEMPEASSSSAPQSNDIAQNNLDTAIAFRNSQPIGSKDRATMNIEIAKLKGASMKAMPQAPQIAPNMPIPLRTSEEKSGAKVTADEIAKKEVTKSYDKDPEYAKLIKLSGDLDNMGALAGSLQNDPNLANVLGPWDSRTSTVFAKSGDVEAKINNLKTLTGFNTLASMREASKTGGALGSISDKEEEMLQNYIAGLASLNQSSKGYKAQLQKVKDFAASSKQRYIEAFKAQYPDADMSAFANKASVTAPEVPKTKRSNKELFDTYLKDK